MYVCKTAFGIFLLPFDICSVFRDSVCFIPDMGNLSYLLFFLSVILELCQYPWAFQRTGSLFYWSLLFFCFEFHWLLIFIISSFLLVLDLFCSFSRFVRWDVILTWQCSFLLSYATSVISFPPSTTLAVPHKFWGVLFYFFILCNVFF